MTFLGSRATVALRLTAITAALMFAMTLTSCKKEPNLTGKWASTGKTLENGEQQKGILDLKQDGNQITGTVQDLGGRFPVKGTVKGTHIELWGAEWNDPKPFLVADLSGGNLQGKWWDDNFRARSAKSEDEIQPPAYIEPPPLHPVPSNGLAKTPPMGWNSWNLFAAKVDDQTVRT
jgi:alpha-galactosidase